MCISVCRGGMCSCVRVGGLKVKERRTEKE